MLNVLYNIKLCRPFAHFLFQTNPKLHLQLLDIEYQTQPMNEDSILDTFKFTLSTNMSLQSKIKFSQRRIEFLEDFGKDITK